MTKEIKGIIIYCLLMICLISIVVLIIAATILCKVLFLIGCLAVGICLVTIYFIKP